MVKYYLNLSIFTVFLKNRNFISKIRRSKVTDYAALSKTCSQKKRRKIGDITHDHYMTNKRFGANLFFLFEYIKRSLLARLTPLQSENVD